MKTLVLLVSLMFTLTAFAFPNGYYSKEVYQTQTDLDTAEAAIDVIEEIVNSPSAEGIKAQRTLCFRWDASTSPFTWTGTETIATQDLAYDIPANSAVTDVWMRVKTQLIATNDSVIGLSCEDASTYDDLIASADFTDTTANSFAAGVPVGTAATMVFSDGCDLLLAQATGDAINTGAFDICLKYNTYQD